MLTVFGPVEFDVKILGAVVIAHGNFVVGHHPGVSQSYGVRVTMPTYSFMMSVSRRLLGEAMRAKLPGPRFKNYNS